jgi:hypothetical protein
MPNTATITVIDHEYIAQKEEKNDHALSIDTLRLLIVGLSLATIVTFVAGAISAL